jgi:predicted tellurium resistance membrane protein TerC
MRHAGAPILLWGKGNDTSGVAMHFRTKLMLSYAFLIALCLFLAAVVSVLLLRRDQSMYADQRIKTIAETTAVLLHDNNDPGRFDA